MDMSGVDYPFSVPPNVSAADTVLRSCRDAWPGSVVRRAEDCVDLPIADRSLWEKEGPTDEFFVYRSRADALSWHRHGSIAENAAGMIHVMIDMDAEQEGASPLVVEVHDPDDERVQEILNGIEAAFAARAFN